MKSGIWNFEQKVTKMSEIEIVRIDNKYTVHTLEQTCRTCSQFFCEDTTLVPLSEEYVAENNAKFKIIEELISFDLKIQEHDGLPQQICSTCLNQVSNIHTFVELCKASQAVLKTYFSELNLEIDRDNSTIENDKNEHSVQENVSALCIMDIIKEENKQDDNYKNLDEDESMAEEIADDIFSVEDDTKSIQRQKNVGLKSSSSKTSIDKCEVCNKYVYLSKLHKHRSKCGIFMKNRTYEASESDYCCFYCEKIFETYKNVHDHILESHPEDQPFTCSVCSENFRIFSERRTHLQSVHNIFKEFKCDICGKILLKIGALRNHIRKNHLDGEYKCEICSKKFTNLIRYQYHVKTHDPNKKFKCQYCDRPFIKKQHLQTHENTHTGKKPYVCETCGESFSSLYRLKNHMEKHNADLPFVCHVCQKGFIYQLELKRHILKHDSTTRNSCNICKKEYTLERDLKSHMMEHGNNKVTKQINNSFKCELCEKCFKNRPLLKQHMQTHDENKAFKCYVCTKSYSRKILLISHMHKIHDIGTYEGKTSKFEIISYKCSKCPKQFNTSASLERHMKLHSEDRKFPCKECGNLYKSASNLATHINQVHLKIRPYSCPHCDQTFPSLSGQILHIRYHTKEKPYQCSKCDKSFFEEKALRAHEPRHTGERPYPCKICSEKFLTYPSLVGHNKKHNEAEHRAIEEEIWASVEIK